MIRRAFLIAVAAVALSAAAAMAFTPAFARASRSWSYSILRTTFGRTLEPRSVGGHPKRGALLNQEDTVQGVFCPMRPPVAEQSALVPEVSSPQMSIDGAPSVEIDSSSLAAAESLLPPTPAICRASPVAPPMQSIDRR
jgi:hypothetical protein